MPRALAIDDDMIVLKMTAAALGRLGYEVSTAPDGLKGLEAVRAEHPDIVITDVMMPGIDGYEFTRRLRRDPAFAQLPVLILTAQTELEEKLKAFEAGADDYLSKPFEPAELAARLTVLLRRAERSQANQAPEVLISEKARFIAVHSLRGGVGATSLAVNIGFSLMQLWGAPTLLLDLVPAAGQIALMLNMPLKRTWADLTEYNAADIDSDLLKTIVSKHTNGLEFVAAPTYPEEAQAINSDSLHQAVSLLETHYEYIVADLSHDFTEAALAGLDPADYVLLMMAPDLPSVRAAAAAIHTYNKLGYAQEKIILILNSNFEQGGLARKNIEAALHRPVNVMLPYDSASFINGMNLGRPFVQANPDRAVSIAVEDLAFRLSKEKHQILSPTTPSASLQRVKKRQAATAAKERK
jgi:pilus assembly protein CpaE